MNWKKIIIWTFVTIVVLLALIFISNSQYSFLSGTVRAGDMSNIQIIHNNNFVFDEAHPTIGASVQYNSWDTDCSKEEQAFFVSRMLINGEPVTARKTYKRTVLGKISETNDFELYRPGILSYNIITNDLISGKHTVCTQFAVNSNNFDDDEYTWRQFGLIAGTPSFYRDTPSDGVYYNYLKTKYSIAELLSTEYCTWDDYFKTEQDIRGDCDREYTYRRGASYLCDFDKKWSVLNQTELFFRDQPAGFVYVQECVDVFVIKQADIEKIKNSDSMLAELQIILGDIKDLNATLQEKVNLVNLLDLEISKQAEIIESLAETKDEQILIISELQLTLTEQAALIEELNIKVEEFNLKINLLERTVDEQAAYIQSLGLNIEEQISIINNLELTIEEQARLINILASNLEEKARYVDLLQAENENQARLITEMRLSFTEQAIVIDAMDLTIQEDAAIIQNLYSNIGEQALLLNELRATNEEKAQIISEMKLTLDEQVQLIRALELTNEEMKEIVINLEGNVEDLIGLVDELERTNTLLDLDALELRESLAREKGIIIGLQDLIQDQEKELSIFKLISIISVLLLVIVSVVYLVKRK